MRAPSRGATLRSRRSLAALLAVTGTVHLVTPRTFDRIIPGWVPGAPRAWTVASGVAELGSAALLATPATSVAGGWAAAATLLAVYPANVQMALDARGGSVATWLLWLRLPLQVPLVIWALRCARR